MSAQKKNLRQIFDLLWSISQNQASHQEINWARNELSRYLIRKLTLGIVS